MKKSEERKKKVLLSEQCASLKNHPGHRWNKMQVTCWNLLSETEVRYCANKVIIQQKCPSHAWQCYMLNSEKKKILTQNAKV